MNHDAKSIIWGLILVILGFLFLGNNLEWFDFNWDQVWPVLMIAAGIFFWIGWLMNRREYGLLMPGTILLIYGLLFLYCANYGWWRMDSLWPVFLLGPGVGFLFMYLLGNRERGLLVPAVILIGLSALFWSGVSGFRYLWPVLLIIVGIYLLFVNRRRSEMKDHHQETSSQTEIKGDYQ
ncbi:MAG: DUF5668 domain-containing protein [Calditrichia bacterium]